MASPPPERVEIRIPPRSLLVVLLTASVFLLAVLFLWEIRYVLELILISAFLALALNPLVTALQGRLGGHRAVAAILVMLGVLVFAAVFLATVLTPLYSEFRSLADRAPVLLEEVRRSVIFGELDRRFDLIDRVSDAASDNAGRLPATAGSLVGYAGALLAGIGKTVTVFFMTLFLLLEIPGIVRSISELLRPSVAHRSLEVFTDVNATIARWTGGVLLIASIAGTVIGLTAWILDVPFALGLALLVGFLGVIPLIGATLGSTVAVLVALTQSVTAGIIMLVVAVVYQLVENHVIQPIVMRRTVSVSPFIVLVSVLSGAALLGVIGALLAIPVAGSIQVVLRRVLDARRTRIRTESGRARLAADDDGDDPGDDSGGLAGAAT
jgi:predicted PurR-regulated permease PerM